MVTLKVADEKRDLNIQNINVKDFQQCPKCPNCSSHINGKQKHFSSNEKGILQYIFIANEKIAFVKTIKSLQLLHDFKIVCSLLFFCIVV